MSTLRIAHATDIHWTLRVPLRRMSGKRMLGTANQVLRGRGRHFPLPVQQALVKHLVRLAPDLVILTGDLTAQALPEEFALARRELQPVLERFPTVILPGNHDVYTGGSMRDRRIASFFEEQLHLDGPIGRYAQGDVVVFTLDPNRPTWINASGKVPQAQLDALAAALDDPQLEGRAVVLALHYPLVDRRGKVYDNAHHGLLNAVQLIDLLAAAKHPPQLILHGHEHHGFTVQLPLGDRVATIIDCGSSGYVHMPERRRAAAMGLYEVGPGTLRIERYLHDGERFVPEEGGAFATGR